MNAGQLAMFADPTPSPGVGRRGEAPQAADAAVSPPAFHDHSPTARNGDPGTSKDFGRGDPSRNPGCARALIILADLGGHGGCVSEVAQGIRYRWGRSSERSVVSRRIKDLRDLGLVCEDGSTRTPSETRRRQLVHFITPEGRAAVPGAERLVGQP